MDVSFPVRPWTEGPQVDQAERVVRVELNRAIAGRRFGAAVPVEEIQAAAARHGVPFVDTLRVLSDLEAEGEVYEPRPGAFAPRSHPIARNLGEARVGSVRF